MLNIGCPYDTIDDGQNKKFHVLFSFLIRIVIFAFYWQDLFVKNIITSFQWHYLNNYTPYENKCFNPRNQNHRVTFVTHVNSICIKMCHAILMWFTCVLNTQLPLKIAEHGIHLSSRNGWAEFWPKPMKFLIDMPNHAH